LHVGVVGLGKMGSAIAHRLRAAGYELVVYNRTVARAAEFAAEGGRVAPKPAAVWEDADVCITMVADDQALLDVTVGSGGLLAGARAGTVLIDMSTVSVATSSTVAAAAAAVGAQYLRAPVSGNPSVVEAGNLTIVASGGATVFEICSALLCDIGPNLFHVGTGEEARIVKLALNVVVAGTAELLAEAIVLGETHGVDRGTLLEVMRASAVGSPFVKYKTAALVADDYASTFTTAAMEKDVRLAIDAAREHGAPLPVTELVAGLLRACAEAGMAEIDFTALLPRLEREAGLRDD
jgi:3-hydroxyisobutyrate dehydrogenase-like beta-hydroxyacid dehydrogenase